MNRPVGSRPASDAGKAVVAGACLPGAGLLLLLLCLPGRQAGTAGLYACGLSFLGVLWSLGAALGLSLRIHRILRGERQADEERLAYYRSRRAWAVWIALGSAALTVLFLFVGFIGFLGGPAGRG